MTKNPKNYSANLVKTLGQWLMANAGGVLVGAILPGIAQQLLITIWTLREKEKEIKVHRQPQKDPKGLAKQATTRGQVLANQVAQKDLEKVANMVGTRARDFKGIVTSVANQAIEHLTAQIPQPLFRRYHKFPVVAYG